ncbi:MAG: hypothetical protein CM15mP71_2020 [Candidatus Poseidoniales archaeon]|nr:MAG: hypothetical protein CM15mP71_2020 [Candidatus Poseidoniales archaeon]
MSGSGQTKNRKNKKVLFFNIHALSWGKTEPMTTCHTKPIYAFPKGLRFKKLGRHRKAPQTNMGRPIGLCAKCMVTDPQLAPEGCSTVYALVPIISYP